ARVRTEVEIDATVARLATAPGGGLIVPPDAYTMVRRDLIVKSAAQHRIPAIYSYRQVVKEGGLISYGPETADIFRRSASYVDRILRAPTRASFRRRRPPSLNSSSTSRPRTRSGSKFRRSSLPLSTR